MAGEPAVAGSVVSTAAVSAAEAAGTSGASSTSTVEGALAVLPGPRAEVPGFELVWQQVVAEIGRARSIDLICHICPDGDALGSALAAGLALRSLGHQVRVSFGDDPQVVPESLAFLPGQELIVPAADVPDVPDLVLCFDVASEGRGGRRDPQCITPPRGGRRDHPPT
ncbi:bifunctional oligoribonuclease/PAP phosphatase NrnA, partial [Kitasatospora indigofera]|uniref:DHH family phosphoesterase n=1 Tax=Kitasatospora indigofera TaxID=67307 RepID=UPI00367FD4A1